MTDIAIDELELELLNGLQIAPRVSWADAARVLGSTPGTLAGRWQRLREQRTAWVTAYPGGHFHGMTVAFIELDCVPGTKQHVLQALCADPRVATIEESARGRDLLLTVLTSGVASLTAFVLDELAGWEGVRRQRTYFAKRVHVHGNAWRLGALDQRKRAAFEALATPPATERMAQVPSGSWPLIAELCKDGRSTAAELARATGRNPATVRRQLARLLGCGALSFRCELAQGRSRWPVSTTYLARVPAAEHHRTVSALKTLPELRLCVSTTGETNMMFNVWTSSINDLLDIEQRIGKHLPWLDIVDSAVTLRTVKRMGWLLDEHAVATGEVVVPDALRPQAE